MTATRTILLALICSAASVTLAAQEAEGGASKKDETPKTEKTETAQPGQIPMIFGFPGGQRQGQPPWMFGGAPAGDSTYENRGSYNKPASAPSFTDNGFSEVADDGELPF